MAKESKMYSVRVLVKKKGFKTASYTGLAVALNPKQAGSMGLEFMKRLVQKKFPFVEDTCFSVAETKLVKNEFFVRHDQPFNL